LDFQKHDKKMANSGTVSFEEIGDLFCEIYVQRLTVISEDASVVGKNFVLLWDMNDSLKLNVH
jgi:hypothetical protein